LKDPSGITPTVICNWSTASEENSSHFIVERNTDGSHFIPIGQVNASGNTSTAQSYNFVDHTPKKGINYYRLKQVDIDGKSSFSRTVAVGFNEIPGTFIIYPNPAHDEAKLTIVASAKETAVYSLFDISGKKLHSKTIELNEGINIVPVSVRNLPGGTYIVKLDGATIRKQAVLIRK
jgi:hypothetical protein